MLNETIDQNLKGLHSSRFELFEQWRSKSASKARKRKLTS